MKKIAIFCAFTLFLSGQYVMGACSLDKIQSGKTCSVVTGNNINIKPDVPATPRQPIQNPNKNFFTPNTNKPAPVQDLGSTSPSQNNSPAGPYNSNCQFGVCPPRVNNQGFNK